MIVSSKILDVGTPIEHNCLQIDIC